MGRKVLKVLDDFYDKDVKEGDLVSLLEGKVKILDRNYRNQYGEFILCEVWHQGEEGNSLTGWTKDVGVMPDAGHPYEILGTIHVPGYRNLLGGIGYFLLNKRTNVVRGFSYSEAWRIIYEKGATNAVASKSQKGNFHSRLLDTTEELPSLDSHYWKIPAYLPNGKPFATLSQAAKRELNKALVYASKGLAKETVSRVTREAPLDQKELALLANAIKEVKRIVVLSGAGISTMSGIPDYRSAASSLWMKNPEVLASLNQAMFEEDPSLFWASFYQLLEYSLAQIMPFSNNDSLLAAFNGVEANEGHRFLSWLEKECKKEVTIITQNVDGLHKRAGSSKVIEFHGNIQECICPNCLASYPLVHNLKEDTMPLCSCKTVLRPNIVFFGDMVKELTEGIAAMEKADLILVVGTSLQVFPFNELPTYKKDKAKMVLLNEEHVDSIVPFDLVIKGNISSICGELKKQLEKSI